MATFEELGKLTGGGGGGTGTGGDSVWTAIPITVDYGGGATRKATAYAAGSAVLMPGFSMFDSPGAAALITEESIYEAVGFHFGSVTAAVPYARMKPGATGDNPDDIEWNKSLQMFNTTDAGGTFRFTIPEDSIACFEPFWVTLT